MTSTNADHPVAESPIPPRLRRAYVALIALGAASALWAVFLWRQLLAARAGEDPFCGFGDSTDCGTLWSGTFASTIHHATGLPIAGWGLAWALVATVLPLLALRQAQRSSTARTALDLSAAAGIAGIVVLLAASAAAGMFCTSCALTYVLTAAYAGVAFFSLPRPAEPRSPQGVTLAIAITLAAYLVLLYPGQRTPKSQAEEGQRILAEASRRAEQGDRQPPAPGSVEAPQPDASRAGFDAQLDELLASLPPESSQFLSDTLHLYRQAPDRGGLEPRVLVTGDPDATVRITEFTDTLCSHCATLHQTVAYLANLLPATSFNVDARQFPLDGRCNAHLQPRGEDSIRCLAARAQICMEDAHGLFAFSGELFKHQDALTEARIFELAAPYMERPALEQCIHSEATAGKLRDDVEYAWRHKPEGTPLVLVNGRQGRHFGPFLYAMILAGGDPDHPAFANLPPPAPPQDHGHAH